MLCFLAEQKFEKKRELAKRLADINARKREEKLAEDEDQLQKLLVAKDLFDDGDYEEFKEVINEQSIPNYDELQVSHSEFPFNAHRYNSFDFSFRN